MRKIVILLVPIVLTMFINQYQVAAQLRIDYNKITLGDKVDFPELPKGKNFYALEKAKEDLNGDGTKDVVILVGEKDDPKSLLTKNAHLYVFDKKNSKVYVFPFREGASYSPKLYFGDMNGDGIPEILNEFPNPNGNGSEYFIGSLKDNQAKIIYSESDIQKYFSYSGKLDKNFVCQLTNNQLNITVPVTVFGYRELYVSEGIYSKGGKVLKQIDKFQNILGKMYFEDTDNDGKDELYGQSIVTGVSEGNVVAFIKTKLVMRAGELIPIRIEVTGMMEDIAL